MALVLINYVGARQFKKYPSYAGILLFTLVFVDISILIYFKYFNFIIENLRHLSGSSAFRRLSIELPLGISFFTFQLVSYVVDVRRGIIESENKFLNFSAYIFMFPHLIAGPIVRYRDIKTELDSSKILSADKLGLAIQYVTIGLCQKVFIANIMAPIADHSFTLKVNSLSFCDAWLGAIAYTLQIYFDFCGYSNMAIGLALALGFVFPRNFNYPYSSTSLTDFWRRWNITLSFWFRDYVYIPLGGSRGPFFSTVRNLFIVFFLTGLWHGAAWNFVIWGLYHGFFLFVEKFFGRNHLLSIRTPFILKNLYVLIIVIIGWVFFRASDLSHAVDYLLVMMNPFKGLSISLQLELLLLPETLAAFFFGFIFSYPLLPALSSFFRFPIFGGMPSYSLDNASTLRVHILPFYSVVIGFICATIFLSAQTLNPFLYFRF
jgi:alginate O-acetyltransferase complex protein AlgI